VHAAVDQAPSIRSAANVDSTEPAGSPVVVDVDLTLLDTFAVTVDLTKPTGSPVVVDVDSALVDTFAMTVD